MRARAWLYLLGANLLAGSAYVATSFVLAGFSPPAAVFWRLLLGAALLAPGLRGEWRPIAADDRWKIAAAGLFGLALPLILGTVGLKHSTATNAALLMALQPLAIYVLAAVFLGEALTPLKTAALLLGVLGSSLIVLQGLPWSARLTPHWRGDVLLLAAAIGWALYSLAAKSALRRVPPAVFTGLTTAVAVLPMAWAAGGAILPAQSPPRQALIGLAFQALGVTYGATLLFNKGLEIVPASTMAQFVFLQPLFGVALGVLLRHDALSVWTSGGGLLILAGVVLAAR